MVRQLVTQLVYTMFKSNYRASFQLWCKENLAKPKRNSKYYENNCLQIFLLHFSSLLTTKFVRDSHTEAIIYPTFQENFLKQT